MIQKAVRLHNNFVSKYRIELERFWVTGSNSQKILQCEIKINLYNIQFLHMMNMEDERKRSWVWFLLPVFLSILGGLIAYYVIRNDNARMAKDCLYIGVAVAIIGVMPLTALGTAFITSGDGIHVFDDKAMYESDDGYIGSDKIMSCLQDSAGIDDSIGSINMAELNLCLGIHGNDRLLIP